MDKDPAPIARLHHDAGRDRYVTRSGARAAGLADSTFEDHAHRLGWRNPIHDLWIPAGVELDHDRQAMAVVEALGGSVLVTGATALFAAGVLDRAPQRVELLVPAARRVTGGDLVCLHRSTTFDDVRGVHRAGVLTAATPRCFADYAVHASLKQFCVAAATATRLRLCTLDQLVLELDTRQRFPGRSLMRTGVGLLRGELTHSGVERLARRLLRAEGLRPHPRPLPVLIDGAPRAEIDIPFEPLRYGVEIDGPHHLLPDVAAADRQRDRLLATHHWTIDRFWWFEVEERGRWFVEDVVRGVRAAGG